MAKHDLVDTTEMYLRTILELEEEGVPPLRARIAERLRQSGPTVSQTVARMERDGLLTVEGDRQLTLTPLGRSTAVSVMRKHRLAELLLVNVIGMPYEEAHEEACRWEHVMSDAVEKRVYELLNRPTRSPYGNPHPRPGGAGLARAPRAGARRERAQPGLPRPDRQGDRPADLRERAERRGGAATAARRRRRPGRHGDGVAGTRRGVRRPFRRKHPAAPRGRLPGLRRRRLTRPGVRPGPARRPPLGRATLDRLRFAGMA